MSSNFFATFSLATHTCLTTRVVISVKNQARLGIGNGIGIAKSLICITVWLRTNKWIGLVMSALLNNRGGPIDLPSLDPVSQHGLVCSKHSYVFKIKAPTFKSSHSLQFACWENFCYTKNNYLPLPLPLSVPERG